MNKVGQCERVDVVEALIAGMLFRSGILDGTFF